jgi:hypothetical protein
MGLKLPHTFTGGGYQVKVNKDRSILVKQGDWLSKYAMAIWGDYSKPYIDKFCYGHTESNGKFVPRTIINKDLIRTGETVYHPDQLPGEDGSNPGEGAPGAEPEIPRKRVSDFLNWIWDRFVVSDWEIENTGGINVGGFFLTGQYLVLDVVHKTAKVSARFHNLAGGLTLGIPKSLFGGSASPVWFPGLGAILRSPFYQRLTLDDFCHGTICVELSLGALVGGWLPAGTSPTMLFFGMGYPPSRVFTALHRYMYSGDPAIFGLLLAQGAPRGVAFFAGLEAATPGVALSARVGAMYDRRLWRR